MIVKLFLILSVVAVVAWLMRGRKEAHRLALTRIGGLLLTGCWVTAVINPDLVSWVANRVGVGRGTDLVLYILVVAFTFATASQYQRIRSLEDRLATLARAHALLSESVEDSSPEQIHVDSHG